MLAAIDFGISNTDIVVQDGVEYKFFSCPTNAKIDEHFLDKIFSYIDIPALAALNIPFKFIGKMQVNNIPVLGYIFRNLHIMVDRDRKDSRKQTYIDSFKSIDEGYSIGIFPEGGIKTEKVPTMAPFKNGAFAMALEKQIPILPVSLLGAYKIMKGSFYIRWSPCEIICHQPISTDGFTTKDVDKFRDKCYKILQAELDKSYKE